MTDDKTRKASPPYVSYRTFHNFLDGLQQGIPGRIDRSYWGDRWSGSTGIQLTAALRFLGLVDGNGTPTPQLRQLVSAKGAAKTELLRQITQEAFRPVLQGSFDHVEGTYAQLEECFHTQYQLAADVSRKCIKFFISLSDDAGIALSPYMVKRLKRAGAGRSSSGTKKTAKKTSLGTKQNYLIPNGEDEIPEQTSWVQMVLSKFPAFDPSWSDEIKLKWFDAFDRLLDRRGGDANVGNK